MDDFIEGLAILAIPYSCMIVFIFLQTIEERRERKKYKRKKK